MYFFFCMEVRVAAELRASFVFYSTHCAAAVRATFAHPPSAVKTMLPVTAATR